MMMTISELQSPHKIIPRYRFYLLPYIFPKIHSIISPSWHTILDLFQPKTSTFSTRALISVHLKTVRYFSQPIFSLFSYLKNALHNLVIELCSALFFFKNIVHLSISFTHSFVAIKLLTFCKNAIKLFYCSRELSLFWLLGPLIDRKRS